MCVPISNICFSVKMGCAKTSLLFSNATMPRANLRSIVKTKGIALLWMAFSIVGMGTVPRYVVRFTVDHKTFWNKNTYNQYNNAQLYTTYLYDIEKKVCEK